MHSERACICGTSNERQRGQSPRAHIALNPWRRHSSESDCCTCRICVCICKQCSAVSDYDDDVGSVQRMRQMWTWYIISFVWSSKMLYGGGVMTHDGRQSVDKIYIIYNSFLDCLRMTDKCILFLIPPKVETRTRFVGTSPNLPSRLNTIFDACIFCACCCSCRFQSLHTLRCCCGGGGEKEKYLRKTSCINARATLPFFCWY